MMLAALKRAVFHFWNVVTRAWTDTVNFYGWSMRTIVFIALPWLVAFVLTISLPNTDGFADIVRSGIFGLIVALAVFLLIFAINLLLTPSLIDYELREENRVLLAQSAKRSDRAEVCAVLKERYKKGEALLEHGQDRSNNRLAQMWHELNMRVFKNLLPEDEFFMYESIAPEPQRKSILSDLLGDHPQFRAIHRSLPLDYMKYHEARLGKLRLIIGRMLESS